jgi:hypothetical protein
MTRAQAIAAVAAICAITVIRIGSTLGVFSPTYDEPAHIAGGYEYLKDHRYTFDTQHPPLARILFAWPFRHATTSVPGDEWIGDILASRGNYMKGIMAARRGNLVFVIIAIAGVALWANELFGRVAAVIAAVMFAMLPPVLAHGGLATTDMAGTAAFPVAMVAVYRWLDSPNWTRTILLGVAIGFGLVTKLSFPLFFAIGAITMMVVKRRFPIVKGIVAHLFAFVIVWGVYFWHHDRLNHFDPNNATIMATKIFGSPWIATNIRLPAPAFFHGLMVLELHDREGHNAYLLGQVRQQGWWYYFPVVLAVKTPLPLLILAGIGTWLAVKANRHGHVAFIAFAMLCAAMTSHINLGVRHLMPIYAPLSILASFAVVSLWTSRARWGVSALCAWLVIGSALAHPDYLPWMSALAGRHPERVVVDSNFDWGQDVLRLSKECRRKGIQELHVFLFGTVDYKRIGLPPTTSVDVFTSAPGWYALSESAIIPAQVRDPVSYYWLTSSYRFQRIGKTIRLYHVE